MGRKEGLKSVVIEYKCKDRVTGKDKYKPGTREQVKNCLVDLCYDYFFIYLRITFLNCMKLSCVRIFSEGEHFIEGGGDKTQQHVSKNTFKAFNTYL